jgi:hypothetical protein
MEEKQDLSIAGPGSPVSLKKVIEQVIGPEQKPFTVLVDRTGAGIAHDSDECIYVTPEQCSIQALYYKNNIFDGRRIPAYLYRALHYFYNDGRYTPKYKTDQDVIDAFIKEEITEESPEYIQILNLIKYCDSNSEAQQIIGLIQLIQGPLSIAKKQNVGFKLYLDRPETALHPKRQSAFMSWFTRTCEEYGVGLKQEIVTETEEEKDENE